MEQAHQTATNNHINRYERLGKCRSIISGIGIIIWPAEAGDEVCDAIAEVAFLRRILIKGDLSIRPVFQSEITVFEMSF